MALLFVVPCCAFDDCPEEKQTTEQTGKHERGDKDDCGTCSPFFSCESCASVTINIQNIYFNDTPADVKQVYAVYISKSIPDVHYDFWRPPRIG